MKKKRSANAIMAVLFQRDLISEALCDAKHVEISAQLCALKSGDGTDATFDKLADMVNIAAHRTRNGDFADAIPVIEKAQTALRKILARAHVEKRWGATAQELRALDEMLANYIVIMRTSTHLEMQRAGREAYSPYAKN